MSAASYLQKDGFAHGCRRRRGPTHADRSQTDRARVWRKIAKTSGDRAEKRFRDLGKNNMSQRGDRSAVRIDQFFAGLGARGDQWRHLVELAEAWCEGSGSRASIETALAEMTPTEEFHAYPGLQLLTALRDQLAANDARSTATLARRITRALL